MRITSIYLVCTSIFLFSMLFFTTPIQATFNEQEMMHLPPRQATATRPTLLINGTFTEVDAKDIEGSSYFRLEDLRYVLEGVLIPVCELEIVRLEELSNYLTREQVYLNLRQITTKLNLHIQWIDTRDTIIIANHQPFTQESVFIAEPLPEHIIRQISGSSFHENEYFEYDHLAYLTITYMDFDGYSRLGSIIVAASIADEVLDIFRDIYDGRFPLARVKLIDYYGADDYYSMADNNSVGFNFRVIAGTEVLSRHAWGMAVDINPIQNPFIRGDILWPLAGGEYLDRSDVRPGMIVPGDVVYNAFVSRGWIWGGHWSVPIDYHHFERR